MSWSPPSNVASPAVGTLPATTKLAPTSTGAMPTSSEAEPVPVATPRCTVTPHANSTTLHSTTMSGGGTASELRVNSIVVAFARAAPMMLSAGSPELLDALNSRIDDAGSTDGIVTLSTPFVVLVYSPRCTVSSLES